MNEATKLPADNERLKEVMIQVLTDIDRLVEENTRLKEQLESIKCCGCCKNIRIRPSNPYTGVKAATVCWEHGERVLSDLACTDHFDPWIKE